ncbi:MAG: DNA primase [Moorea sp. SIO1G6]|uniref:DNA primase n=1 Tax=Moorena sp. SIO1G6 TaxID=2607840 RepID=UPI0013C05B2F|nr:DNA primase [Moorena sp. SIO1G6]NET68375.1 DNA primase [Moorena sp. SIO1G6]
MPKIHPATIAAIKEKASILEVIEEHVTLRQRGKNYVGLCPFHDETTPSFTVNPAKQLYHCFGCGAAGDAIKFLTEHCKESFTDVVTSLADRYHVPVTWVGKKQTEEIERERSFKDQLYEVLALAKAFYEHNLRQPDGAQALEYLRSHRNLPDEIIREFGLGYAPPGWQKTYDYLTVTKKWPIDLVSKAGLIVSGKEGRYYDRFRGRVIIPIHDAQGRVIGFGGRSLDGSLPKYLNSPESLVFHKSKILFGLDKAKSAICKRNQAIITEGFFDVIALHRHGFSQAVACLGTALTSPQLQRCLASAPSGQIILNLDGDPAGVTALTRVIINEAIPDPNGLVTKLRVLALPTGKDPDEFLTHGVQTQEHYQRLINEAPLALDWQINQQFVGKDLSRSDHFQDAAENTTNLLKQIKDRALLIHYICYCAQRLANGEPGLIRYYIQSLQAKLNLLSDSHKPRPPILHLQNRRAITVRSQRESPLTQPPTLTRKAEELLLQIYLHCPDQRSAIAEVIDQEEILLVFSHHRLLWQTITELHEQGTVAINDPPAVVIEGVKTAWTLSNISNHTSLVSSLFEMTEAKKLAIDHPISSITKAVTALKIGMVARYRQYCLAKWEMVDPSQETTDNQYYWQEFQTASKTLADLESKRRHHEQEKPSHSFHYNET